MATSRLPVPKCPLWSATALSGVSTGQDCGPPTSSGDKKREGLLMSRHGSKIGKRLKIAIVIAGVLTAVIVALFALNYWFLSGTSLNKCRGCISQTQYATARLGQARATIIAKMGPPEARPTFLHLRVFRRSPRGRVAITIRSAGSWIQPSTGSAMRMASLRPRPRAVTRRMSFPDNAKTMQMNACRAVSLRSRAA